jgi:hypothetical protein
MQIAAVRAEPVAAAWESLTSALGLTVAGEVAAHEQPAWPAWIA